jgi:hypothetical protein
MNEMREKAVDQTRELDIDELDAVSGGGLIGDFIDRAVAIYRFYTGTIKDIATTLP